MTIRQVAGLGALGLLAMAGGWAVSTVQTDRTGAAEETAPVAAALDPGSGPQPTAPVTTAVTVLNADALPPGAGGVDGVDRVLLMDPGTPRSMPPGALFAGDEVVEERYLLAWDLNGQQVDVFRYLKRNGKEGPGTYLCFATAVGNRAGGGGCIAVGDPPDPSKPGSRRIGEDEFLNVLPLGSGAAYVLQVPPGTTHVVVTMEPVPADGTRSTAGAGSTDGTGDGVGSRVALIPLDGIAMIAVPGSTTEMGVEFTAWEGSSLLASARPG